MDSPVVTDKHKNSCFGGKSVGKSAKHEMRQYFWPWVVAVYIIATNNLLTSLPYLGISWLIVINLSLFRLLFFILVFNIIIFTWIFKESGTRTINGAFALVSPAEGPSTVVIERRKITAIVLIHCGISGVEIP